MLLDTDSAIQNRKTIKVLADKDLPCSDLGEVLHQLLALAGMAPFHRACDPAHREPEEAQQRGIEPWRFHVLEADSCRILGGELAGEQAGKIPSMLAAADAMILATWLPNPPTAPSSTVPAMAEAETRFSAFSESSIFEPTLANMEHIAAASAAIQNLLLAATARGIANYWSSGGVLRSPAVFKRLGIPSQQILLGALFLFPSDIHDAQAVGSKLRPHRTPAKHWSRTVKLGGS